MPLYVFENQQYDVQVELPFAIAERPEEIVLKRKTVPDRVAIAGSATSEVAEKLSPAYGYRKLEERGQLDPRLNGGRKSDFTNAQRKAALELPPT